MAFSDTKRAEGGGVRLDPEPAPPPPFAAGMGAARVRPAVDRSVAIQFVQFCLVGTFSTALNEGLFNLFFARGMGVGLSYVLAFSLAVTNGFFLNRAWTFRRSRPQQLQRQYTMFVAVNLVGLGLSLAVMYPVGAWLLHSGWAVALAPVIHRLTHRIIRADSLAYSLGVLAATPPCAVWNFGANKLWTFNGRRGGA